jgi:hypothetical protein
MSKGDVMIRIVALLGILAMPSVAPVSAAQIAGNAASIAGSVADTTGFPLAGAVVVLRNEASSLERVERTDRDGAFAFSDIAAGRYAIVASAPGFDMVRRALDVSGRAPVSLVLPIAPYQDRAIVGIDSRQVLVLIDGQPVVGATRATLQAGADKLSAAGVKEIVAVPLFVSSHSSVIEGQSRSA